MTREEFKAAFPDKPLTGGAIGASASWNEPILSDALAVHPNQIDEVRARNARHGLNVEYLPDGRPVLRDRATRRRLLRIEEVRDRSGGYSD